MVQFYGTVLNTVKMAQLDNKWMQKKDAINNGNLAQMTAVERMVYQYEEQCKEMRESDAKKALYEKVASGRELTPEEVAYLKKNNPTAYQDYLEAKEERESYRRRLRECETKEEVENLKLNELSKFMATAKKTESNPNISKAQKLAIMQKLLQRVINIQEEHVEFVKTSEYAGLPEDMEEKEDTISKEVSENDDLENATDLEMSENVHDSKKSSKKSNKKDMEFEESVSEIKAIINEVKSETKKIDMKV